MFAGGGFELKRVGITNSIGVKINRKLLTVLIVRIEALSHISYCLLDYLGLLNVALDTLFCRQNFGKLDISAKISPASIISLEFLSHSRANLLRESSVIKISFLIGIESSDGMNNRSTINL